MLFNVLRMSIGTRRMGAGKLFTMFVVAAISIATAAITACIFFGVRVCVCGWFRLFVSSFKHTLCAFISL